MITLIFQRCVVEENAYRLALVCDRCPECANQHVVDFLLLRFHNLQIVVLVLPLHHFLVMERFLLVQFVVFLPQLLQTYAN